MKSLKFRGFTLIELLIAMTILLSVVFIGTYSYNLYARYWGQELGHFEKTLEEAKGVTIMFSCLKNYQPLVFLQARGQPYHYFEGGKSVIRTTVQHSLTEPEYPAAVELKVEQVGEQKVLFYREAPIKDRPVLRESDLPSMTFEIRLLQGFEDLTFEFRGWPDYSTWLDQVADTGASAEQWYGYYSGKDTQLPPSVVKVTLSDNGELSSLQIPMPDFSPDRFRTYFIGDE